MFVDTNSIGSGSVQAADVCIIGGGAAGISIALELLRSKSKVIVVESGGYDFDQETQSLYAGTNTGVKNFPLDQFFEVRKTFWP